MSLKSRIEALTTQISNAKTLLRPISLNKGSIKNQKKLLHLTITRCNRMCLYYKHIINLFNIHH